MFANTVEEKQKNSLGKFFQAEWCCAAAKRCETRTRRAGMVSEKMKNMRLNSNHRSSMLSKIACQIALKHLIMARVESGLSLCYIK